LRGHVPADPAHAFQTHPNDATPIRAVFVNVACNKDAFPTRQRISPANPSLSLPKQAQFSCVDPQAQYQAFVRFAVTSSAALSAIALQLDLRFGTFYPAQLSP
jgi:hypothetical protein